MVGSLRARTAPVLAALLCVLSTEIAHAQRTDIAGADLLFDQGRQLMTQGRVEEACAKFAESEKLAPAAGTALNLGLCYQKQGKSASAWGAYREAMALASSAGQADREKFARQKAASLEPNLIRVKIVVPPDSEVNGLEVKRDGIVVAHPQFGTAMPIDPGLHTIDATAPGKLPFRDTFNVAKPGQTTTYTLVPLKDAPKPVVVATPAPDPAPPPPPPEPPAPKTTRGPLPAIGIATAAVGLAAIGAGVFFGLDSQSKSDEVQSIGTGGGNWSAAEQDTYDSGETAATMANAFFIAGGVILVTGGVLAVMGFSKKPELVGTRASWTF
jgi:hypothetical protein